MLAVSAEPIEKRQPPALALLPSSAMSAARKHRNLISFRRTKLFKSAHCDV